MKFNGYISVCIIGYEMPKDAIEVLDSEISDWEYSEQDYEEGNEWYSTFSSGDINILEGMAEDPKAVLEKITSCRWHNVLGGRITVPGENKEDSTYVIEFINGEWKEFFPSDKYDGRAYHNFPMSSRDLCEYYREVEKILPSPFMEERLLHEYGFDDIRPLSEGTIEFPRNPSRHFSNMAWVKTPATDGWEMMVRDRYNLSGKEEWLVFRHAYYVGTDRRVDKTLFLPEGADLRKVEELLKNGLLD